MDDFNITAGDFLAGGGGVTEAMSKIQGMQVRWVLNHDQIAIRTNIFNHKNIKHYWSDIYKQDEHDMEPVDFVWASIECTQHSQANGGREKKIGSYMLGWELVRYIKFLFPYVVGIENVPEFKKWAPLDEKGQPDKKRIGEEFARWKNAICALGYDYHESIRNAADDGIPTRRVRYFAFFTRKELGMEINWPEQTHDKRGNNGLKKWVACKNFIDLTNEGESIFGREFNPNIPKGKRKKLVDNTLRRIAGGIKKYAPELFFIMHYYGQGTQFQSLNNPLNTIPTNHRHALITLEKLQFIQDHCHNDHYNLIDEPLNPILKWQTKQFITFEKKQFIADHCHGDNYNHVNEPLNPQTTQQNKRIVTAQFISKQYNSNGKPEANNHSIDEPLTTLTTQEKSQFISTFFEKLNQAENGEFDFDIKMRFLEPEELARISTFPKGYFTNPLLKLNVKEQTRLIGNAVPPEWAKIIIEPVVNELKEILQSKKIAI